MLFDIFTVKQDKNTDAIWSFYRKKDQAKNNDEDRLLHFFFCYK